MQPRNEVGHKAQISDYAGIALELLKLIFVDAMLFFGLFLGLVKSCLQALDFVGLLRQPLFELVESVFVHDTEFFFFFFFFV